MNRRKFLKTGVTGIAGFSIANSSIAAMSGCTFTRDITVDKVKLGKSGLTVSRIAMGTGTVGWNKQSNQTRLGMDNFVRLARHGYDRGIRFYDTADTYGSIPYVGNAIKGLPREKITLLSKIWTHPDDSDKRVPVAPEIDRFRTEFGTDYIDILLMHFMNNGDWPDTRHHYMDGLSRAKQDGIVKAVGVSCHNIDALRKAAATPWVDVIMARINPFGTNMDGKPEVVKEALALARENGKGVIGMKIFGEGKHVKEDEREQSIHFALTESHIHCMTLGLESIEQMDDAIDRVMKFV
ncbi:aryl-alcohol dehydrogenase-like predicted oxidoreductase [Parabacteroides sp. PFB2-10]|uniref:aldo/keto reductase n=1 Tax=Parabacteroides sp. PFB2-10 TaxID=1742405 RepID=UPI002474F04E|nr:aldo/keto reductase [Parabacteroides sp. PFB2-10]MDH6312185.1 aryl-alcohol dehydrogenase-like predicted oxidoreductase [Parabacteroides sp. PFB2-10]